MESEFITRSMPKLSPNSPTLVCLPSFWKQAAPFSLPGVQSSTSWRPSFYAKLITSAASTATELQPTSNFCGKCSPDLPRCCHEPSNKVPVNSSSKVPKTKRQGKFGFSKERLKQYSTMLRQCSSKVALNEGRAIHGNVVRKGVVPDSHLWVSLTSFYAKCGRLEFARKVLDETPERDVVSWTALISGFVSERCGADAASLYCVMRNEDVRPNEYVLATTLKACSLSLDVDLGRQVHAEAVKAGLLTDLFVASGLVDLYAKCKEIELADSVFFSMPEKNEVLWNVLLNGYAQLGNGKTVLKLFSLMVEWEHKLNRFTLSTVLKGCAKSGHLIEGKLLHSVAIKTGHELDEFVASCLIDMYSKCGLLRYALQVFKRIKDPDVVIWSAMIVGLHQQGHSHDAAELYQTMILAGVRPNQYIFSSLVSAATSTGDLCFGKAVHACICKYGMEDDILVSNALIMMYMKYGQLQDGIQAFNSMTEQDTASWSYLLSGFCDSNTCEEAPRIFNQMLVEGFRPNMYTFIDILRSCSSFSDVHFGRQVHAHIIKNCNDRNDFVRTALIDMYAKGRCIEDAVAVFDRLVDRDLFTWTIMIDGYAKIKQPEMALKRFVDMQSEGVKPNEFTIASSLNVCSHMANLEGGQQLHSMVVKAGHTGDIIVATSLTDMYGKCGCIEDAEKNFKHMVLRDAVSWNTIVAVHAYHSRGGNALQAYRTMIEQGFLPDEVTFLSVLSVCSNMGLVEEGKKHFESITKVYGITKSLEHYACMISILGRAGQFDEVVSFIKEQRLSTHALIWETVLGACKLHGNLNLGETAARKLFELQPKEDSAYIFLSNIFAAKGRWDDVQKIRGLMSEEGVKKEPGCSWVSVDGQVHVFVSQDGSHPKTEQIYVQLQDLKQRLSSSGYIPKTESVLHNISSREKMEHLWHHSERLALGLALISTIPGKPIRIFKNLRICEDCHGVMKVISDVTSREIVIRDLKRFHHFKLGSCSCQDNW